MERKKKKDHGNHSLQSQISHSTSVDLQTFQLEYLELQKSNWCKLNCVGFLTRRPIFLPNLVEKELIWERYDLSKMTHEFCQQTCLVKKQVQITSHPNRHSSLYFSNLAPLSQKSKPEDFMQGYFSFFNKIVIEILKCKLST
jgi:hypothetical protein